MTKCDQCDSATINGVFCHEFGCPNRLPTIPDLGEPVYDVNADDPMGAEEREAIDSFLAS